MNKRTSANTKPQGSRDAVETAIEKSKDGREARWEEAGRTAATPRWGQSSVHEPACEHD
jgi:hypothetical protein